MPFADYQNEIYLAGIGGTVPEWPFTPEAWEARARDVLDDRAFGYVAGGAASEDTMRANREAFRRYRIVPRMLRDVSTRDLTVELFGRAMPAPVLLAPVGVQSIVHADGELATARAAKNLGLTTVLSTASSHTLEDVAATEASRWFQLYWPKDPDLAVSLAGRAESAGYEALVVTLDTWMLAWRPRDLVNAYLPFLQSIGIANYQSDPVFMQGLSPAEPMGAVLKFVSVFSDPSKTWSDLAFLREHTGLPIVLKGILHPDDAQRAVDEGVDAIIVSNHGGRQVDGAIAAIDALASIDVSIPVLFDSGIRTGADIVKALALGARAVLVGRPYMWGLAVGGEDGATAALRQLLADLDLTMALSGLTSCRDLDRSVLAS